MSGGGCNQRQPARMPPTSAPHIPVLLSEVVTAIAPAKGDIYLDGTFGAGGYTRAVLEAAGCSVLALDRDPQALADAGALVDAFGARLTLVEGCFGDMEALAQAAGFAELDGVMLDLGVSSMQLDQPARGFSLCATGRSICAWAQPAPAPKSLLMKPTPPCSCPFCRSMAKSAARAPLFVRLWCGVKRRASPAPANSPRLYAVCWASRAARVRIPPRGHFRLCEFI